MLNIYKNRRLNYLSVYPFCPVGFFTFATQADILKDEF
jgi:hypothetical protein